MITRRTALLTALLILASAFPAPRARAESDVPDAGARLPPVECVQMLRSARVLLDSGNSQDGVKLLRETAERFPDEIVALVALWEFHKRFGLPTEEAERLHGLLIARMQDPLAPLPPGVLRYLLEDPDADDEELEQLLGAAKTRLKADDAEMLRAIADLQLRLDLLEEARLTLTRLKEVAFVEMLDWDLVLLDIKLKRWSEAADGLKPFVAKDDAPLAARMLYIDVLSRLGRYEEMVRQIGLISMDNPLVAEVVNKILRESAWNLRDVGKDEEAEAVFRRVLAANPRDTQAKAALAYLYGSEEEIQAHRSSIGIVRAGQADDPYALLEEAGNLLAAGDAERALGMLERASVGLPGEEIVWYNLGLAALKLERWESAEAAFLEATKINPARADSFLNRGSALYRLDRCAEAIEVLERALELAPDKTNAHYYLYACHAELGDQEAATEAKRLYEGR